MATGAFAGVQVTASVAGDYLGHARFDPFWATAEATEALVFVHPTTRGFADPVFERHYLWNLIGNPMETTIAAADLVMGGTLERHPGLRILLAHAGGAIVALRGRLRHGHHRSRRPVGRCRWRPRTSSGASFLTPSPTIRRCCTISSPMSARIASCSAPTIPSTWATPTRSAPCARPACRTPTSAPFWAAMPCGC